MKDVRFTGNRRGLACALIVFAAGAAFAQAPVTDNNTEDRWGVNNLVTFDGHVLWWVDANGDKTDVRYYDGTSETLLQAYDAGDPSLDVIGDTTFSLGSGSAPGTFLAAWRRGADYAWLWDSTQPAPIQVDTLTANPFAAARMNPEGVAIDDGCMFMILQANAGVVVNHVYEIDPATGAATSVSGTAAVSGVDEVRSSGCEAVWVYNPNPDGSSLPLELQHWDGLTTTTLDSGALSWNQLDFVDGHVVYLKDVGRGLQVFGIDLNDPVPVPEQLSDNRRNKLNPQTDGDHVVWAETDVTNFNSPELVTLGGMKIAAWADLRPPRLFPYMFHLDHGQLVWKTGDNRLIYLSDNEWLIGDNEPTLGYPQLSMGQLVWFADETGTDTEIYVYQGTAPTFGTPAPPLAVEAIGDSLVKLRWSDVRGAERYNVYYAEQSGVTAVNYSGLPGGTALLDVTSPLNVPGLDKTKTYYFVVTTESGGTEGPESGEAIPEGFTVDATGSSDDANVGDGICADFSGDCTLRSAILEVDGLEGRHSIVLPAGTYSAPSLTLSREQRIVGDGRDLSIIDGLPVAETRVLHVNSPNGPVTLTDLAIRGGSEHGIESLSDLVLERVTVADNGDVTSSRLGSGIWADGPMLTVIDSRFENNLTDSHGGGMAILGTGAWIERTEFVGNHAGLGGGAIYDFPSTDLRVYDSEMSQNTALWPGGGINSEDRLTVVGSAIYDNHSTHQGGGVYALGTAYVTNTTIYGNAADQEGGGIAIAGGRLHNVTLHGNTTALAGGAGELRTLSGTSVGISNSIVANSSGQLNCTEGSATILTEGYNLESQNTCGFGVNDIVNTDPMLGPFGGLGGMTPGLMPAAASAAIDGGNPDGCEDHFFAQLQGDQRGAGRAFDGDTDGTPRCDIGAIEWNGACGDVDGDGFGSSLVEPSCNVGPNADCDDGADDIHPGAPQVCDGRNNDCASPAWPLLDGTNEADDDLDGLSECSGDCIDTDGSIWSAPGETRDLTFLDGDTIGWTAPLALGGTPASIGYDATRSEAASDLSIGAVCLAQDQAATSVDDADTPASPGDTFFYLSRARNLCPQGKGSWGQSSQGAERTATVCP